jgi:hypothetical protein
MSWEKAASATMIIIVSLFVIGFYQLAPTMKLKRVRNEVVRELEKQYQDVGNKTVRWVMRLADTDLSPAQQKELENQLLRQGTAGRPDYDRILKDIKSHMIRGVEKSWAEQGLCLTGVDIEQEASQTPRLNEAVYLTSALDELHQIMTRCKSAPDHEELSTLKADFERKEAQLHALVH